jgi:hypothetical protein
MNATKYENQLENLLRQAGIRYRRQPSIGGLRPDFLVAGPHGEKVVLEVKLWDPRGGNTARAVRQAELYRKATGADRALIVMPNLKRNYRREGVVRMEAVVPLLRKQLRLDRKGPRPTAGKKPRRKAASRTVFAAMPFAGEYDDTFLIAMSYAAQRAGAVCQRVDRREFSGDVVAEIERMIRGSSAVIVDLSEAKPNVLYEAGYAHALRKPVVHICSTPLAELPFDVRNWNTIPYRRGRTALLRKVLARRLKAVMG